MDFRTTVDRVIEAPIVTSFTRIGFDIRSRLDEWASLDSYDLTGRTVLVTGATSGLGLATATQLARCGAEVLVLGRDEERTERVRRNITTDTGNEKVSTVIADMGDMAAVRGVAEEILERSDRLDALVHNAGALSTDRRTAPDGTEATVASQVVGPFLLTGLLLERLSASAPSRVVTVSSGGMYPTGLTISHLEMSGDEYKGAEQYARAKRAQVTLNEEWAARFASTGVRFHAMHPGWADTPGVEASLPTFRRVVGPLLRSPAQGADTIVWLVADDGAPLETNGTFWLDRRPRSLHKLGRTRRTDTPERRNDLWRWCVDRSGLDPEEQM